jgi:hypothetical protein
MQTVITVTDVTWLFAKEKFNTVVGKKKKVAVRLLDHKYEESRLWSYPRRAEFSSAAL